MLCFKLPVSCVTHSIDVLSEVAVTRSSRVSSSIYEVHLSVTNGTGLTSDESEDQTYVVDFGLHSNYQPFEKDLEQVFWF